MTDEIVPVNTVIVPYQVVDEKGLIEAFFRGKNQNTREAYTYDLADFTHHLGFTSMEAMTKALMSNGAGAANSLVLAYRDKLRESGARNGTINRRMGAIRSMVKLARMLGLVNWTIEVPSLKNEPYRDTRGPGESGVRRMLEVLGHDQNDARICRNRAIIHMLYDMALRRSEVVSLDVGHLDTQMSRVSVLGKKRQAREWITVPRPTLISIQSWLPHNPGHKTENAPMFVSLDHASYGQRLSARSVYNVVSGIGKRAGIGLVRPHGLRHAAITAALDKTGGDIRSVQKYARHEDPATTMIYDDNVSDAPGNIGEIVAEDKAKE